MTCASDWLSIAAVAVALAGCSATTPAPPAVADDAPLLFRGPPEPVRETRPDPGMAWGTALFPTPPKPPEDPPPVPPAPVVEAGPPPVFGPTDFMAYETQIDTSHPDLASFCAEALKPTVGEDAALENVGMEHWSCTEVFPGVSFQPDATFLAVRAVRVTRGSFAYTRLLVRTKAGLSETPISWAVEDPRDPGCPSIIRLDALDRIRVENGLLVVVALGETRTAIQLPNDVTEWRDQLSRQVTVFKALDDGVYVRTYQAWGGPSLGEKIQPNERGNVPWSQIPWKNLVSFKVSPDGVLTVGG